jgi:hypothetical protein
VAAWLFAGTSVAAHDVYQFVGPVVKWDAEKNILDITTLETGSKVLHIVLRDDTPVTRSGTKVSRSELKTGQYVRVDAVGVDLDDIEGTEVQIYPEK